MSATVTSTGVTTSNSPDTSAKPANLAEDQQSNPSMLWQRRETRRTFKAEDGKTYFLPKCVHFRPESNKHARASLHLQLSAGLYLCNGQRCSDKGGNVDFKATHVVTKAQVLVLRAFRDLMGWRPYGEPASSLHELLAGEVFRLWEKTRRANDPSATDIDDDEPVRISPAPHKFGDTLPKDVEVTIKAGILRQACKEKRKRATAIYDSLCSDSTVLAGSLEEAPPHAFPSTRPPNRMDDSGTGIVGRITYSPGMSSPMAVSGAGPSTPQPPHFRPSNAASSDVRDETDDIGQQALSSLLTSLASRGDRESGIDIGAVPPGASDHRLGSSEYGHSRNSSTAGIAIDGSGRPFDGPVGKRSRIDDYTPDTNGSRATVAGGSAGAAPAGDLNVGYGPGRSTPTNERTERRHVDTASAARRQLWYREVQANDARLRVIKEEAEREHSTRMRQLMSWIVDEEGGKHDGLGADAGPGPASWER